MRFTLLLLLMFFLLPARSDASSVNTRHVQTYHAVPQNLSRKSPVKSVTKNKDSNLFDDDFDLDDDYQGNDSQRSATNCISAYHFPDRWHSAHTQLFIVDDYCQYFRNFPAIIGHTSPIYITLRVLRI